jgi:hypothetical protein
VAPLANLAVYENKAAPLARRQWRALPLGPPAQAGHDRVDTEDQHG